MRSNLLVLLLLVTGLPLACNRSPTPAERGGVQSTTRPDRRSHGDASGSRESRQVKRSRESQDRSPGSFDFYLLNLSWSPEFCATHPPTAECGQHRGFTLHGLWPQNNDGSYPEHCGDEPGPVDASLYRDLFPEAGLLRHEWSTHGTCSGLAPDVYLRQARKASESIRIPASLSASHHQPPMTPEALLNSFVLANPTLPRASLALSCGGNSLTAIEVCLTKNLDATACRNVRSCRANVVRITPIGSSDPNE